MTSDAIERLAQRTVSPDELRDALEGEISHAEREEILALVRWFTTRYPTAEERLAYLRQAYKRWQQTHRAVSP